MAEKPTITSAPQSATVAPPAAPDSDALERRRARIAGFANEFASNDNQRRELTQAALDGMSADEAAAKFLDSSATETQRRYFKAVYEKVTH